MLGSISVFSLRWRDLLGATSGAPAIAPPRPTSAASAASKENRKTNKKHAKTTQHLVLAAFSDTGDQARHFEQMTLFIGCLSRSVNNSEHDIIFYLLCSLCVLYEDDSSFVLEEKKDRARVCGVCACIIETEERSAKECVRASPLLI